MILEKLYRMPTSGKVGIENMKALHPHPQGFLAVHVAGTNGKGTVATHIAQGLQMSGKKVGLYTSPHLFSYNERIRVNGKMISDQQIEMGLKKLFELAEAKGVRATPFELTTLLAFEHFREQGVDWAVIEVGLGGRFDATNIISPDLCVITSISYDHTDKLGETLDEIAWEKAGIIKPGVPVIIGKEAALEPILSASDKIFQVDSSDYIQIAKEALKQLGINAYDGKLQVPCRMEKRTLCGRPVIFDVAHNQAAIRYLLEQFEEKPSLIFAFSKQAELDEVLGLLKGCKLYLPHLENPWLIPTNELLNACKKKGIEAIPFEMVDLDQIIAGIKTPLAITGSFYLMQYFYQSSS